MPPRSAALVTAVVGVLLLAASTSFVRDPAQALDLLLFPASGLPALLVGALIAARNRTVGLLVALMGAVPIVDGLVGVWIVHGLPGAEVAAAIGAGGWMWLYTPPILLALVFPDGRVATRGWRVVAVCSVALPLAFGIAVAVGGDRPAQVAEGVVIALAIGLLVLLVLAVVRVARRYRIADESGRRQIRWFALSSVLLPAALVVCWIEYSLGGSTLLVGYVLMGLFVLLPASVGVAMLRHELYGVDRLLAGTVRWALLVAAVGAVFAVIATALGALVGDSAGAALAAVVALVAGRPLHGALRRAVDRRFQPRRHLALSAVEAHVEAVRAGAPPEDLEAALRRALGDPDLIAGPDGIVPGRVPLTAKDVQDIDAASVLPRELARLRGDLREALAATAASRSRILEAADAERARIERDLHDGAQQQLVAAGMRLRSVQRAVPAELRAELDEAVRMVQDSIGELRRIAQGVRPAALDDGLGPALRAMVRSLPVPVDLELEPVDVLEPAATTAYYVVAEAVTNAMKHAGARRISVALARHTDGVRVEVHDDGRGGAVPRSGGGLAGLADRIEAVGGSLRVAGRTGGGTTVTAVLP